MRDKRLSAYIQPKNWNLTPISSISRRFHAAASLMAAQWNRPYSRETGAFPLASLKHGKYWPPVGRVDNVYGDRNLFCSCGPVGDYAA